MFQNLKIHHFWCVLQTSHVLQGSRMKDGWFGAQCSRTCCRPTSDTTKSPSGAIAIAVIRVNCPSLAPFSPKARTKVAPSNICNFRGSGLTFRASPKAAEKRRHRMHGCDNFHWKADFREFLCPGSRMEDLGAAPGCGNFPDRRRPAFRLAGKRPRSDV